MIPATPTRAWVGTRSTLLCFANASASGTGHGRISSRPRAGEKNCKRRSNSSPSRREFWPWWPELSKGEEAVDWIEQIFGVSLDGGNGSAELLISIVIIASLATVAL